MIVLLLILAHLIADFWLQTDQMVMEKMKNLKKHSFHHFLCTSIVLLIIWMIRYEYQNILFYFILPLCIMIISHILIDWAKIRLIDSRKIKKSDNMKSLSFFLIDQLLHLAVILTISLFIYQVDLVHIIDFLTTTSTLQPLELCFFLIIMFIVATNVSGHIVKHIVGSLPSELANFEGELMIKNNMMGAKDKNQLKIDHQFSEKYRYVTYSSSPRSRGKFIGYLERLLVIVLTVIGAYPSIAFIIAAKSIARFKQLDDRNWAEYFLLGTLSSIFLGLLIGLFIQAVIM